MGAKFGKQYGLLGSRGEKERLLFVAAAGLALSLLIITLLVLNLRSNASASGDKPLAAVGTTANVGTVTLLAPERLVPAGRKLSEIRFKEIYWPRNQVPEEAIRDISEITNLYAKADLQPNMPVSRSSLTSEPMSVTLPLTPGMRAVSIEVDATSGLEGHALPGTRVDVVLTFHEESKLTSKVIVQNARVLSYGGDVTPLRNRSPVERAAPIVSKTITLEVSPEDSLKITTARQMGRLSLIMRASDDMAGIEKDELSQTEIGAKGAKDTKSARSGQCTRGKMKMGGQEYVIDCDGNVSEIVNPNEP